MSIQTDGILYDPLTIADPGATVLLGWDDTDNLLTPFTIGSGLSYSHATYTLSATGVGTHNLLSASHPDADVETVVLGDILVGNATPHWDRLGGNVTTERQWLRSTGAVGAATLPTWDTLVSGDTKFTATDKILGRQTAGAGAGEEIACDTYGRALLGAGSVAAQRTALGLGTASTPQFAGLLLDATGTEVLLVRRASDGGDVLTASTTDRLVKIGDITDVLNIASLVAYGGGSYHSLSHDLDTAWTGLTPAGVGLLESNHPHGFVLQQMVAMDSGDPLLRMVDHADKVWAGLLNTGEWRLFGMTSGYVGLKPAAAAGSLTFVLPSADGSANQALVTDGSKNLSFASVVSNHNLLSAVHPDTVVASPVLGDILYGDATPNWTKLAGNITTTKKFLRQTGTGAVSAVPAWDTVLAADVGLGTTDAPQFARLGLGRAAHASAPLYLNNNAYVVARNAAGSADLSLLKANATNQAEFGIELVTGPLFAGDGTGCMELAGDTGSVKVFAYQNDALADDGIVNLPNAVSGWVLVTCNAEAGLWLVQNTGAVVKIAGSVNTADTDFDGSLCVYDGGTRGIVKNRLAATGEIRIGFHYN